MENTKPKYILYGASFNPPHIGHFDAISQMLDNYDKVIVYPYPKQYRENGKEDFSVILPKVHHRMKMLNHFLNDFFPGIMDRIILNNLSTPVRQFNKLDSRVQLHTIDYLEYAQKAFPEAEIHVCLGLEEDRIKGKTKFHRENEIVTNYGTFELKTSKSMNSATLRKFLSSIQNAKSPKNEKYIHFAVGRSVAEYIFTNGLYQPNVGKVSKKIDKDFATPTEAKGDNFKFKR